MMKNISLTPSGKFPSNYSVIKDLIGDERLLLCTINRLEENYLKTGKRQGCIDVEEFAEKYGFSPRELNGRHPNPYHLQLEEEHLNMLKALRMDSDERNEMDDNRMFVSVIENALFVLMTRPYHFDKIENGEKGGVSIHIIESLNETTTDDGKIQFQYRISEEFQSHLTLCSLEAGIDGVPAFGPSDDLKVIVEKTARRNIDQLCKLSGDEIPLNLLLYISSLRRANMFGYGVLYPEEFGRAYGFSQEFLQERHPDSYQKRITAKDDAGMSRLENAFYILANYGLQADAPYGTVFMRMLDGYGTIHNTETGESVYTYRFSDVCRRSAMHRGGGDDGALASEFLHNLFLLWPDSESRYAENAEELLQKWLLKYAPSNVRSVSYALMKSFDSLGYDMPEDVDSRAGIFIRRLSAYGMTAKLRTLACKITE